VTYLVSQADRIQDELLNHFWDQRISMTPYRVSSRAGRSARWLVVFAFVGMMVAVKSWWKQRPLWILLGLTMGGMFVVGHFWYDWFQLRYNGQEYLKSRYFYPLLPFIGFGMAQGISIIKDKVWQATVVLFLVSIFIWLNYSALGWLLIYIE
jgi:hypothetical protein